jgi:hypothetical protein
MTRQIATGINLIALLVPVTLVSQDMQRTHLQLYPSIVIVIIN